jgi:hypothetical protein
LAIVRDGASIADGNLTLSVFGAVPTERALLDLVGRARGLARGLEVAMGVSEPAAQR